MITRTMLSLAAGLIVVFPVQAATVEDCIGLFRDYKRLCGNSLSASQLECQEADNYINYYATAAPPHSCIDEDEWHLDARAVGGNEGKCSVRLIGSPGPECGADKVEYALGEKDAEKWMGFLRHECDR